MRSTDSKVVAGPAFRTIAQTGIKVGLMGNGSHISPLNPWLHMYYVATGVNSFGAQVTPVSISHARRRSVFTRRDARPGLLLIRADTTKGRLAGG